MELQLQHYFTAKVDFDVLNYFLLSLLMIVNSHREFLINRFGMVQTNLPFYNKLPSVMGAGERVLDLGVRFDFGFCHLAVIQPVSSSEKN